MFRSVSGIWLTFCCLLIVISPVCLWLYTYYDAGYRENLPDHCKHSIWWYFSTIFHYFDTKWLYMWPALAKQGTSWCNVWFTHLLLLGWMQTIACYMVFPTLSIQRLQRIQNSAARLVARHQFIKRNQDDINLLCCNELHLLPVIDCIVFKILLLTYKSLHSMAPDYISDLFTLISLIGLFAQHHSFFCKFHVASQLYTMVSVPFPPRLQNYGMPCLC